jgi:formylmethanofuran dehydrogenase subunit C
MRGNLTVSGKTGDRTGEYMRGTLSIAGTAGSGVGNRMRGRLTISGTVDFSVGWEMGGTLRITGKAGPFAGESMVGECIITGQADYRVGDAMTGALVIEGQAGRYPGNGLIGLYSAKGRHSWLTYRSSHEVFSASHNDTRVTDAIAQEFRMRLRRFARTVCYDSIWDDDDLVDVGIFHEKPDLERWHRFRRRIHRRYGVEL